MVRPSISNAIGRVGDSGIIGQWVRRTEIDKFLHTYQRQRLVGIKTVALNIRSLCLDVP